VTSPQQKVTLFYVPGTAYLFGMINLGPGLGAIEATTANTDAYHAGTLANIIPALKSYNGKVVQGVDGRSFIYDSTAGGVGDPFARLADPDLINPVYIEYPDSFVTGGNALGLMASSIQVGVNNLISAIQQTPGPFMLAGYSQGAVVTSQVYQEIISGVLQDRRNDLLAGVTFGNPVRQKNHTWPGSSWSGAFDSSGSSTGGHGCLPEKFRMTGSIDSLWWDFTSVGDVFSSVGDTTVGANWQLLTGLICGYWGGSDISTVISKNLASLGTTFATAKGVFDTALGLVTGSSLTGHCGYPFEPPPGDPQNGLSSYQIALNYLNSTAETYLTTPRPVSSDSTAMVASNKKYLSKALQSNNPVAASTAALTVATEEAAPIVDIEVTFYTKTYGFAGLCADYKKLSCVFNHNAIGTASIVLKHTDPLVPVVMDCWQSVVPVTIKYGYLRWSGRVEYVDYEYKEGEYSVIVYCTDDYQWFDKIMCWPDPFLPIQFQIPSRAVYIGPAITCIKTMIAEQVFRLQSGLWEIVDNAASGNLDWRSWFGTLLENDGDIKKMLTTPIVVVPTNPFLDPSPWTSINGRMDKLSSLMDKVMKSYGLHLTADLWLPGEPQPNGLLWPLTVATIVVDVKDMSGVTGPTGTFIDGIIKDVVDLNASVLGDVLKPFLNPRNEYAPEGINIAPALGVNFVKPWVVFSDNARGGIREFHLIPHSPLAHTVIGGGKSPHWINDLINVTLEFFIDAIEIAIGFTGIPSAFLDGTFDDIILAFQLIENSDRRISMGPYCFPEYFQQTGSSAYTLDEWFALRDAMWDTRGYHGIIVSFDNGYPYTIGKDIFLGGLASMGIGGYLYTDYVKRIEVEDSPQQRAKATVVIGDGKTHEAPAIRIQRSLAKFQEAFQILTLSN